MIAYLFAWLSRNRQPVLIWSFVVVALLRVAVGGFLTWREWIARKASA